MLLLDRRPGETIIIDHDVEITVLEVSGGKVCIGINAPKSVSILRDELLFSDELANDEDC